MSTLPISRRDFVGRAATGAAALACSARLTAGDAPRAVPQLTMLNSMAGSDLETVARRHVELGLKWLDLKDGIRGHAIDRLPLADAAWAAGVARTHGLGVFCFSTALGFSNLEDGEAAFRARHLPTLEHVLKVADILRPQRIRLISPTVKPFPADGAVMEVVERRHAWVFGVYREMIDRMVAAGQTVLLENETPDVVFNRPEGILRFFARLDRAAQVRFTWDAQNLWQMGVFPTPEVYRTLRPLIGCLHLKGGRTEGDGRALVHAAALEDASWPVADIVRAAVADGVAPFICINPSHGKKPPGWNGWEVARRDIAFLQRILGS